MKNIKKYLLFFFAATIIVSCGDEDLEPVLSLDKDLASGIKSEADLGSVLNSAYDRMADSLVTHNFSNNSILFQNLF